MERESVKIVDRAGNVFSDAELYVLNSQHEDEGDYYIGMLHQPDVSGQVRRLVLYGKTVGDDEMESFCEILEIQRSLETPREFYERVVVTNRALTGC